MRNFLRIGRAFSKVGDLVVGSDHAEKSLSVISNGGVESLLLLKGMAIEAELTVRWLIWKVFVHCARSILLKRFHYSPQTKI